MTEIKFTARVQVTVEIDVNSQHWNEQTPAEQLHREGTEIGVKKIEELCQRYVRLVGKPTCDMIIFKPRR